MTITYKVVRDSEDRLNPVKIVKSEEGKEDVVVGVFGPNSDQEANKECMVLRMEAGNAQKDEK